MNLRVMLVAVALIVGVFVVLGATAAQAVDDDHETEIVDVSPQIDGVADSDSRVEVQTWTIFAAVGAAAVGLLVFMVRAIMGWVKPPPPQEESPH